MKPIKLEKYDLVDRQDVFEELLELFTKHIEAKHIEDEAYIEASIMDILEQIKSTDIQFVREPEPDYNGTTEAERIERMQDYQKLK